MSKTDRSVVRNQAYQKKAIVVRERHNERKNQGYSNPDVIKDRTHLNVHFKSCEGTYTETFDKMIEDGAISTRGLKQDAKVFDELVFDVNTAYFERNGGYEYAKQFFEEAYRMAVKEAGGEQYVLSAVMHADERNKALSEQLGRDVYHYHLHVIYVPVVDKEVKWTKRCKDPTLVGTTKEIIKQVSHSKKWLSEKAVDENGKVIYNQNGKAVLISSYSLLQDRFFEHMQVAGYRDFERGERGSTAEHLTVLDYKIQQEKERAAVLDEAIEGKENTAATLDKNVEKKKQQLSGLQEKATVTKQEAATFANIDGMAKKTMGGNYQLTPDNWEHVSGLAKEGVKSRGIIAGLKERITTLLRKISGLEKSLRQYEGQGITDTMRYYQAQQRAPRRMVEFIADVLRRPSEQQQKHETARPLEHKRKSHENEL